MLDLAKADFWAVTIATILRSWQIMQYKKDFSPNRISDNINIALLIIRQCLEIRFYVSFQKYNSNQFADLIPKQNDTWWKNQCVIFSAQLRFRNNSAKDWWQFLRGDTDRKSVV